MSATDFNRELPTKLTVVLGSRKILTRTMNAYFDSEEQAVEFGYGVLRYFPNIKLRLISVLLEQKPQYKARFWKTEEAIRELEQSLRA